jgi:hypothetical protein
MVVNYGTQEIVWHFICDHFRNRGNKEKISFIVISCIYYPLLIGFEITVRPPVKICSVVTGHHVKYTKLINIRAYGTIPIVPTLKCVIFHLTKAKD